MLHRALVWAAALAAIVVVSVVWTQRERGVRPAAATIFSARQPGCPIVIPADAIEAERQAAELLRETLALAAGLPPGRFPIVAERRWGTNRGLHVGATRRAGPANEAAAKPPHDTAVALAVRDGAGFIRSERREAVVSAASWFLETHLEARWFIPGPLGASVPRRTSLVLTPGTTQFRPGYISRDLGVSGAAGREWHARNRLEARFDHSHNLVNIFQREDFLRTPEMAPMHAGARHIPPAGDQNWQPNMLSEAAVQHAVAVARRAFAAEPKRLSFSLSTNDAVRYDDSPETLAAVSPARYFRHRPDYSNLVFRFTNAVADEVAKTHPERYLPAYAYYWCENTPDFRVARNVVPYLTADRSQWSHAAFAAEDKALIERWCRSGAEIVGVYDYFYGNPFFSPRPTLYAVQESIPFHFRTGVRAFYAEMTPNWSFDGPKPWLAAQLLWDPTQNPAALLEVYYREFWGEAAGAMRDFFATCEKVWLNQPGPALWLRYFRDDDQAWIYPPAARAELREHLTRAEKSATTPAVRARVALASRGLAVAEAYWAFAVARERASTLDVRGVEPGALLARWRAYRNARDVFVSRFAQVQQEEPLALAAQDLEIYLRNQPDGRVARELARTAEGRALLEGAADLLHATLELKPGEIVAAATGGEELLHDPSLQQLQTMPVGSSGTIDWTYAGSPWRGSGEPWEGRAVELRPAANGGRALRMSGCRTEGIGQWTAAVPGAIYHARVKARAKTSPGTATFLIVSFLDEKSRHIGIGRVDRLPAGADVQEGELCLIVRAPPQARFIGYGLRVLNQINDDFVEFSGASLRRQVSPP